MILGALCSQSGQAKSFSSVVESKVRNSNPDITPMFPCNTCTQYRGVFYCSQIVNPDTLQFQTNAWNKQNSRQCYRMRSAHLSKIRLVMAALYPVFWRFDSVWRYRRLVTSAPFTRSYIVTTVKSSSYRVRNWLAPVQFGGITAIARTKTGKFAGGQIQLVVVQHWWCTFFKFLIFLLTKQLYNLEPKCNYSWWNAKIIFTLSVANIRVSQNY
jgi:hypothetical protein